MMKSAVLALASLAIAANASTIPRPFIWTEKNLQPRASNPTTLDSDVVQKASEATGQINGVPTDGESNSATDNANFINFCKGQTLTNGEQVKGGSCNGIVMGRIPSTSNMVSTIILSPRHNEDLPENTTFNVTLTVANMTLGSFTNATSTYYSAPQDLSPGGQIVGHTHVTVQSLGDSLSPSAPLDASAFAFFKGINDAGNGHGTLTTAITGGLPAGNYRVCTMSSASNHQPVLMPVAQRGAQDDCTKFTVGATKKTGGSGGSSGGSTLGPTSTTPASNLAAPSSSAPAATVSSSSSTSSTKALGGIEAPPVTDSGDAERPFEVNGNTFVDKAAAVQRACSIQNNACADASNAGKLAGVTVADCNAQEQTCNEASS